MKKECFVDMSFLTFRENAADTIFKKCRSTMGYLELISNYDTYFVIRNTSSLNPAPATTLTRYIYKGTSLKRWQLPLRFSWFIRSLRPNYILVHGFGYAHYL